MTLFPLIKPHHWQGFHDAGRQFIRAPLLDDEHIPEAPVITIATEHPDNAGAIVVIEETTFDQATPEPEP